MRADRAGLGGHVTCIEMGDSVGQVLPRTVEHARVTWVCRPLRVHFVTEGISAHCVVQTVHTGAWCHYTYCELVHSDCICTTNWYTLSLQTL